MKEIVTNSWEDFEDHLSALSKELEDIKQKSSRYVSIPLFRGQADATWLLKTTLDRTTISDSTVPMHEYYVRIQRVRPAVISLTGKDWVLPKIGRDYDHSGPTPPPGYEFMIYLRHHGFPSPLLDWSRSPYVAAYFAFRFNQIAAAPKMVAIYSYVEYIGKAKTWAGSAPHILNPGSYVVSHKRHYSQQCEYTICKKRSRDGDYVYARHEDVVARNEPHQDRITKYVIPGSEREKVMDKLGLMNITAFSLFGSEESLMETLAYSEIEKSMLYKPPEPAE